MCLMNKMVTQFGISSHVCIVTVSRLLRMGRQEVCVQQEVTVLWVRPLPSHVPPAPSATAPASADLSSVSAVRQGKASHTPSPFFFILFYSFIHVLFFSSCQFLLFRFQQHLSFGSLFSWFLLYRWLNFANSERSRGGFLYPGGGRQATSLSSWDFSAGRK